ncbi:NAD-dependent epimerase/dehydratase family protein [Chloroflexota bacterium]
MQIFVTGGAGFIGSHLVDRLVSMGKVTVYDNLSSGKKEFIKHHLGGNNFTFVQADLLDFSTLSEAMRSHGVVFHLAANPEARWGIQNTRLDLEQETLATYNVLEAMRVNEIEQIIFASSGTIYGETPVVPLPEDYGPALPISLYGAGKLASEGLISAFCGTFAMRAWIFRFANVVGKRTTHGVIFDFIRKLKQNHAELEILGDGNQRKPYLHVADCIEGVLFGFQNSTDRVNVFNLGCSSATDVNTIARMLVEEMGLEGVAFKHTGGDRGWPGDVPQVRLNVEKMSKLGWRARYTSDEAVRKAIREILEKE